MTDPGELKLTQPTSSWPRHFARLSMVAAVLCFLVQLTAAQLGAKNHQRTTADEVRETAGISLLVSGFALAAIAMVATIRRRDYDTGVIALIGLTVNGGVLALVIWWQLIVRPTLPPPQRDSAHARVSWTEAATTAAIETTQLPLQ